MLENLPEDGQLIDENLHDANLEKLHPATPAM